MFQLHKEPLDYQLSVHLDNLINTYNRAHIEAGLAMVLSGVDIRESAPTRRLNDLLNYYGTDRLIEISSIFGISNTITKRVKFG